MSAVFSDTGVLKKGDDVRVAGVPVGEVTGVHADFEAGQVIVNVEVDEGIDLGPQTRAAIGAATLLGGYYLRLSGPVAEPFLHELPAAERRITKIGRGSCREKVLQHGLVSVVVETIKKQK